MRAEFTSTEVAALTGIDELRIRKEVEHGLFGPGSPPRFDEAAFFYFRALKLMHFELGPDDRRKLYVTIREKTSALKTPATVQLDEVLTLRLGELVRAQRKAVRDFNAWKRRLVVDDAILGGEPVFPKSRLAVRHIGALMEREGGEEEVREDYPKLTARDLEYARIFAKAYPRRGRPRAS